MSFEQDSLDAWALTISATIGAILLHPSLAPSPDLEGGWLLWRGHSP